MLISSLRRRVASSMIFLVGLLMSTGATYAQTGSIEGRVTDAESGEPLPGVNVILRGTNIGAATRSDGTFALEDVTTGTYTLRASLVGYRTAQRTVTVEQGQITRIDIELAERDIELDDVVVTGVAGGSENEPWETPCRRSTQPRY